MDIRKQTTAEMDNLKRYSGDWKDSRTVNQTDPRSNELFWAKAVLFLLISTDLLKHASKTSESFKDLSKGT